MGKIDLEIDIIPNNYMPGFAAYVNYFGRSWIYKLFHKKPKILINFNAMFGACVEEDLGISYKDFFAENVVHEMLHMIQDIFNKTFDENEVENAIISCRKK